MGKKEEPKSKEKFFQKSRWSFFSNIGLGKERGYFVENLSMLVSNGMPILGALDAIAQGLHSRRMKNIVAEIKSDIEIGSSIWQSLAKTNLFPEYAISLIRLGEASGNFAENLKIVEIEQDKDRSFQAKIRSAMMYPVFVFSLTIIIGVGIAWFILPKLALVFSQLKIKLPLVTKILIGVGQFFSNYGIYAVPAAIAIMAMAIFFIFFYTKTKFIGQFILFSTPGIKRFLQEVEISRFGYLLGTLLAAGLPIDQALDSLANATAISQYKKFYTHLRDSLVAGNSLQKSFAAFSAKGFGANQRLTSLWLRSAFGRNNTNRFIPVPIQQLIAIGEQSGSLSETFLKIGQRYEAKSDATTKNFSVILEPILLVIVWLGVVAVAMAVILPIYSLIGGFKT